MTLLTTLTIINTVVLSIAASLWVEQSSGMPHVRIQQIAERKRLNIEHGIVLYGAITIILSLVAGLIQGSPPWISLLGAMILVGGGVSAREEGRIDLVMGLALMSCPRFPDPHKQQSQRLTRSLRKHARSAQRVASSLHSGAAIFGQQVGVALSAPRRAQVDDGPGAARETGKQEERKRK